MFQLYKYWIGNSFGFINFYGASMAFRFIYESTSSETMCNQSIILAYILWLPKVKLNYAMAFCNHGNKK